MLPFSNHLAATRIKPGFGQTRSLGRIRNEQGQVAVPVTIGIAQPTAWRADALPEAIPNALAEAWLVRILGPKGAAT